jgi:hypothetical protein
MLIILPTRLAVAESRKEDNFSLVKYGLQITLTDTVDLYVCLFVCLSIRLLRE